MRFVSRFAIALLGAATMLSACEYAPVTGRSQIMLVSESQEREMGLQAYRQVLASEPASHDRELNALVEKVGRHIAAAAESPPAETWRAPHYHWEFHAIKKDVPNAFCLPGGKIAVYTGLFPITRNEAGLAVVIGHEVGHALARHSAERLSDQGLAAAGLTAAAVALGTANSQQRVDPLVVAALGAGATVGILLPMSREQEAEADRIGLVLMARAGYDPHEAIGLWERMRAANKGGKEAEWLSTHPADETRIANIRRWIPEAMRYYRHP